MALNREGILKKVPKEIKDIGVEVKFYMYRKSMSKLSADNINKQIGKYPDWLLECDRTIWDRGRTAARDDFLDIINKANEKLLELATKYYNEVLKNDTLKNFEIVANYLMGLPI